MKRKTIYCAPVTEVLLLFSESVLNPSTWNGDYPFGDDQGIIEGDPTDENGDIYDGHGAKANDPFALFDLDWDDNDKGLWD